MFLSSSRKLLSLATAGLMSLGVSFMGAAPVMAKSTTATPVAKTHKHPKAAKAAKHSTAKSKKQVAHKAKKHSATKSHKQVAHSAKAKHTNRVAAKSVKAKHHA